MNTEFSLLIIYILKIKMSRIIIKEKILFALTFSLALNLIAGVVKTK